jgi:predicted DNA repair protein MutK
MVAFEKEKVKGAIRTDFILSAEIIVITLGTVAASPFITQLLVLSSIALLMTVGVYGLVAGIVKLDDLGMKLIGDGESASGINLKKRLGIAILTAAPYLMKFLSVAGTAAMFLVGGGILVHGIPPLHHVVETIVHRIHEFESVGKVLASLAEMIINGLIGLVCGTIVLVIVTAVSKLRHPASAH